MEKNYKTLTMRKAVIAFALLLLTGPGVSTAYSQSAGVSYSGPLIIRKGGTYSGNWQSLDSSIPAIQVETSEPVIIENSNVQSAGILIKAHYWNNNVTIRNTRGYGLRPSMDNVRQGRFFDASNFKSAHLEHNYMEQTSGIYLADYKGNKSPDQSIKVLYNQARNIDGRYRNGGHEMVQFVQFNNLHQLQGVEIAWNEIINEPNKSLVEDNINFYMSSGTQNSPFLVHDNYIQGAFPIPATKADHTGGGIMLGDGNPTSITDASGFAKCYNNQVVGTLHYGIGVANGHDIEIYNNRVVSSGYADGQYLNSSNVGMYTVNSVNSNNNTDEYFFNISVHDNKVGYTKQLGWTDRNDLWFRNIHVNERNTPLPGPITAQTEQAEWILWLEKIKKQNITPGLIAVATPAPAPAPTPAPVAAPIAPAPIAPANAQFHRAININGPALTLDGNKWESSTNAANITIAGEYFSSQHIALNPSAEQERAQMIRSSIGSRNASIEFSTVASGNYLIYLYIWEDNFSVTYDVSVQGKVAQAGAVSGSAGSWKRMGPYTAIVTEGKLSVAATGPDNVNISGVEVWKSTIVTPVPNLSPSIVLTAPNATSDVTVGQTQLLIASASDPDGSVQKVEFFQGNTKLGEVIAAPYQFNWTAATAGTIAFTARATDNAGASATSSEVSIRVVAAPVPTPAPAPAPAPTPAPTPAPAPGPVVAKFYRAININGNAITLDGNMWEASAGAANVQISGTLFSNQTVKLRSTPDATRAQMIRSAVGSRSAKVQVGNVPNGNYNVYVYVWEDNKSERFSLLLNGKTVLTNYNSGPAGNWDRIGPLAVTVINGTIQLESTGGEANVSGMEIWTAPSNTPSSLITKNTVSTQSFPNPFEDIVMIQTQLKEPETMNVALFNQVGRLIQRRNISFTAGIAQSRLDMSDLNLPSGRYYLLFMSGSLTGKTIKLTK